MMFFLRAWFFPRPAALPPGARSLSPVPHRRTARLLPSPRAQAIPHRRAARIA